jgi:RecB family exonuclease
MLSRATYPEVWSGRGYPPRPNVPALLGDVVHRALEIVLREFLARGCVSVRDPSAVVILKDLGGYSKLAERAIRELVDPLADNPRAAPRLDGLRAALLAKVPDIRQRVQVVVSRTALQPGPNTASDAPAEGERWPLGIGTHPEAALQATDLRLGGRVDLITLAEDGCRITDYKTGAADPHHSDQVRTYALLWTHDGVLNPSALPVRRLTLSYPTHDIDVEVPTGAELVVAAAEMAARIDAADLTLQERPPEARPAEGICRLCGVRQLCEDYWAELAIVPTARGSTGEPQWFDLEATVASQNGPRSWLVTRDADQSTMLLRTPSEGTTFRVGDRVRLLNLLRGNDPEAMPVGSMTQASEVFMLEAQG